MNGREADIAATASSDEEKEKNRIVSEKKEEGMCGTQEKPGL